MCKKNVNVVTKLFESVINENNDMYSTIYKNQFNTIDANFDENNVPYIGNFYIVTDMNLLGTTSEDHSKENNVNTKTKLECKIRISKLNADENKQYYWDIEDFDVPVTEENCIHACVDFVNYSVVTFISKINLKPDDYTGKYVVKILIKNIKTNKYLIQSLTNFYVK